MGPWTRNNLGKTPYPHYRALKPQFGFQYFYMAPFMFHFFVAVVISTLGVVVGGDCPPPQSDRVRSTVSVSFPKKSLALWVG